MTLLKIASKMKGKIMITAVMYRVSWNGGAVRALALSVVLTCGIALAMLAAYVVVALVTPLIVATCGACVAFAVLAAPVVAKLVGGLALVAVLAWVSYPR